MIATATNQSKRDYYQGSERFGSNSPLGTLGYKCRISHADYTNGDLELRINGGLPERTIRLYGDAALGFLRDMKVSEFQELIGKRVSMLVNSERGIERIASLK
ncbi:hypothetical protein GF386_04225 [Candidatus Pacearchaeota archaeon]|nr:hypothetical protein [Candidatus Pacearchaeota archaeon]